MTFSTEDPGPAGRGSRARSAAFAATTVVVALALLEGFSSCGLFSYDAISGWRRPVAERQHTDYDAELGWVSRPGTFAADIYGVGRSVTINAQGFRARSDVDVKVAPGKARVVCSGDSMTFGYGVDDDDTWPAQLAKRNPWLEVVNMGQGGYGVDQMYLWYERDGRRIEHHFHLFALIWNDFSRMRFDSFMGYGKPTLKLEDGRPVADNVPVPRRAFYLPWLTQNLDLLRGLRSVQLAARLGGAAPRARLAPLSSVRQALEVGFQALRHTHAGDLDHGSRLVVVWLPVQGDEQPDEGLDPLRRRMVKRLRSDGIAAVDLVEGFRALPPERLERLFLRPDEIPYPGAVGHYSPEGNRFIAARVDARMRHRPELGRAWTNRR